MGTGSRANHPLEKVRTACTSTIPDHHIDQMDASATHPNTNAHSIDDMLLYIFAEIGNGSIILR